MKAILFSIGTKGDIEPFLDIAQLLKAKKWDVLCVFLNNSEKLLRIWAYHLKDLARTFWNCWTVRMQKMYMGGGGSIFKRLKILIRIARAGMRLKHELIALQHNIQKEENQTGLSIIPNVITLLCGVWQTLENP